MPRQALHAAGLRLVHPRTGRPLDLEAPLPEDFERLMEPYAYQKSNVRY
ncbi:MAG: hypothetical protein JRK53_23065 [Deltaproteobacteria bacterium]|nr:hypothetical protein [Deltaproteobacteria bacterium]MBW1819011.1 hypothetical protein [Deltaproteobacteria bacterium]